MPGFDNRIPDLRHQRVQTERLDADQSLGQFIAASDVCMVETDRFWSLRWELWRYCEKSNGSTGFLLRSSGRRSSVLALCQTCGTIANEAPARGHQAASLLLHPHVPLQWSKEKTTMTAILSRRHARKAADGAAMIGQYGAKVVSAAGDGPVNPTKSNERRSARFDRAADRERSLAVRLISRLTPNLVPRCGTRSSMQPNVPCLPSPASGSVVTCDDADTP